VTASSPLPARRVREAEEKTLDAVIKRIERSLLIIHRHTSTKPSSDQVTPEKLSSIRRAFQGMSEDSILTDDESDIRLDDSNEGPVEKINGTHP